MNNEPKSLIQTAWAAVWLVVAALIVGSLLVSFLSANWGWLLLGGVLVAGIALMLAWLRWRRDRW